MGNALRTSLRTRQKVISLADFITLADGSGGKEMEDLIKSFAFTERGAWEQCDDDAASLDLGGGKRLLFTTDSYTVDPIFFSGGDIGHLSMCGTINDLVVMGAKPLGISLGLVIEEGLPKETLAKILKSVKKVSKESGIPVVTGDTKVMERGKIDKIVINTAGVGMIDESTDGILLTQQPLAGDKLILSGGLGEHAVALLSQRFEYETSIRSDSKPLFAEMEKIASSVKIAKDPTRGGIAASLNELSAKYKIGFLLEEKRIPAKEEVRKVVEMLGLNLYELACEGRLLCIAAPEKAESVLSLLRAFNEDAAIIGEVTDNHRVVIQTFLGKRILPSPSGRLVPRIC